MSKITTYADYNAQAPLRPEARAAVESVMSAVGNPSSVHAPGRKAKAMLDEARDSVAALVGARPADVVFTSGAVEANNIAVQGAIKAGGVDVIFVSEIEHPSVWRAAQESGVRMEVVPALCDGHADVQWLNARLADWTEQDGRPLVCLMLANNETGVIQSVQEAADLAHRAGGYLLCDAVQGVGKIAIDLENLGADYLALSAHKVGGLAGSGALIVRGNTPTASLLHGGGQEMGRRAGTENLAGAAAFGAACAAASDRNEAARVQSIRDAFEAAVRSALPEAIIVGEGAPRVGNTSCVVSPGSAAETIVLAMDMAGVACSAGSACSSGKVQASRVLLAMGMSEQDAKAAVRFSFGWNSVADDGAFAAGAYIDFIRRLRDQRAA